MQARDRRILNLLSEKAEKGDKQAQAVHDYLIPIFEQADKKMRSAEQKERSVKMNAIWNG